MNTIGLPVIQEQASEANQAKVLVWTDNPSGGFGKKRLRVYLNEFNVVLGAYRYLPYSTGLLRAYAETFPEVRANCEFMPFLFEMESLPRIMERYTERPDVAAFSCSMWNEQLNLRVAVEVKKRWSDCLIVFGGCHVPHHPEAYMKAHPFIDVCVRGDGEEVFVDILKRRADGEALFVNDGYEGIVGMTFRRGREIVGNCGERVSPKELDKYPSPYLEGYYDYLMSLRSGSLQFQAIVECSRNCPFPCSFCFWGKNGTTKFLLHSLDRVKAELDWMGRNKVEYLFASDSNFSSLSRDYEIAEAVVATKKKYEGYPEKFRVCYAKNSDERVFKIATLLHEHDLEKGITLARQSNDPETLRNINRQNISLATYRNLQTRFNDKGIPVYVELILGLPGETKESWVKGVDDCLLRAGGRNALNCYLLQILPNTECADPEYQRKHGMQMRRIELQEIHGSPRGEGWVREEEEIVIATDSMPHADWRWCCKFTWLVSFLHSMKVGFFVLGWLWDRFEVPPSEFASFLLDNADPETMLGKEIAAWDGLLDRMMQGEGRGQVLPGYGDFYWDVEEAAFLRAAEDWRGFYCQVSTVLREFLAFKGVVRRETEQVDEIDEVLFYQRDRMPDANDEFQKKWSGLPAIELQFFGNVPEYFDKLFGSLPVSLERKPQVLVLYPKGFGGDPEKFARETIMWGRKSGTMLVECKWRDA